MKTKKTVIWGTFILIFLITAGVFNLYHTQPDMPVAENLENIDEHTLYKVNAKDISSIAWVDNGNLIFVSEKNKVNNLEIESRNVAEILVSESPFPTVGVNDGKPIVCDWFNRPILSPEQIATEIEVFNIDGELIKKIELNKTVMPINCSLAQLELQDNYHSSPGNFYTLDFKGEQLEPKQVEAFKREYIIEGDEKTFILDASNEEVLFEIKKFNVFISASINKNKDAVALLDYDGGLWIYAK